MAKLSPAAQQVFWEFNRAACGKPDDWHYLPAIAAALRAAVDQAIPLTKTPWGTSLIPVLTSQESRDRILAIAAELEATAGIGQAATPANTSAPTDPPIKVRRQPLQCPSPATIAECGGPCEAGFMHCDCGLLEQLNPPLRPTPAPADSLVERVRSVVASADSASARAAIREVAGWLRSELVSRAVADRLEQEANQ